MNVVLPTAARDNLDFKGIVRAYANVVDPHTRNNSRTRRIKKVGSLVEASSLGNRITLDTHRLGRVIRLKPQRHRIEGTSFPDTRRSHIAGQVLPHDASGNMEEEIVHGTGQPPYGSKVSASCGSYPLRLAGASSNQQRRKRWPDASEVSC